MPGDTPRTYEAARAYAKQEINRRLEDRLRLKKEQHDLAKTTPPRYDEVWLEGVLWLNSLE